MPANRYFPGSTVSRYLPVEGRSWDDAVYQSGKPVLDSELNLSQEVKSAFEGILLNKTTPSGWVRPQSRAISDFAFPVPADPAFVLNTFYMGKQTALVAGIPLVIEYTSTTTVGQNLVQLSAAPVYGGAPPDVKRTDFVFLEVFRALVSPSPHATATVTVNLLPSAGDTITINGIVLTAVVGAPGVDQYTIAGTTSATAQNIVTAINLGTNSFTATCTSQVDVSVPNQVNLRAVPAGAAGNAFTLSFVEAVVGTFAISGPLFAGGVNTPNKPTQSTIYRNGNTQAPGPVNFPDDIEDPIVGAETTKRVQVQYRLRATGQAEAVNFKTENGFSNPNVVAQGTQGAPVVGYPFVPANLTTVSLNSSAPAYGAEDAGLWVAGDGSSAAATALGTVDGFAYAIPVAFVFRRNDAYNGGAGAGFSPLNNTNGALPVTHALFANPEVGAVPANASDRPDGLFHNAIVKGDVLDLRKQVSPSSGVDLTETLNRQMQALLDGNFATWAIDAADKNVLGAGSGDVSTVFLVCNEVGRSAAEGGVAPSSGSTTRGDSIANFDHIRRRFADDSVVERIAFPVLPTDTSVAEPGKFVVPANAGYLGWAEDDVITLDFGALNATGTGEWSDASKTYTGGAGGGTVAGFWPPGTVVTDVLRVIHDDGNYNGVVSKSVQLKTVTGLGTQVLELTLDANNTQVTGGIPVAPSRVVGDGGADDGSQRRIFVEVEITYPVGAGTTDTVDVQVVPDPVVYPSGPLIEDDPTQRPLDFYALPAPVLTEAKREVALEYVAGSLATTVADQVVSDNNQLITMPRRIFGSAGTVGFLTVTDVPAAQAHNVNLLTTPFGSSTRILRLVTAGPAPADLPLSGVGQTLCTVNYNPQDPLPNYGAVGYQLAVYFRTNAPQTVGSQAGVPSLPASTTLVPLAMSRGLWTGTVGVGSVDLAFPYPNPSDQIAVSGNVPVPDFPGEWVLSATAPVSVSDFSAGTGLLNLHQLVQVDGNPTFTFTNRDKDTEFRAHYKVADPAAYRPTAMAQPLSGQSVHKAWFPFLAYATTDTVLWRKGEVLLVVVSRFFKFDSDNSVRFDSTLTDSTCAAIYRTRGLLLLAAQ
jgi:hypothetical protein